MKFIKNVIFYSSLLFITSAGFSNTTFNKLVTSYGEADFFQTAPVIERQSEAGQVMFFFRPLSSGSMTDWALNSKNIVSKVLEETDQIDGSYEVYYPQDSDYTLKDTKESILAAFHEYKLFEQLKNKKVILVGHSLGANVAIMMGQEFSHSLPTWVISIAGAPLGYPNSYSGVASMVSLATGTIPEMMPTKAWHQDVLAQKIPQHRGFNVTFISSKEGTGKTQPEDFAQMFTLRALNSAIAKGEIENHDRVNPSPSFDKIKEGYQAMGIDWIFFFQNDELSHMAMLDAVEVLATLEKPATQFGAWSRTVDAHTEL